MVFEKLCLIWLFVQDQSILSDSIITVYTTEGSTTNLIFNVIDTEIDFRFHERFIFQDRNCWKANTNKYVMILRPNILEFQIRNVSASATGIHSLDYRGLISASSELKISNISCPSRASGYVCANEGSSPTLTFLLDGVFDYHTPSAVYSRQVRNYSINVDLQIYNATLEDEGIYRCFVYKFIERVKLPVAKLWFINQTDLKTIVGQEGKALHIKCISGTGKFITALQLESNGIVKAIGDKQTVSYSFIPNRTDHLTKYKCVDNTHSAIIIEVEIFIRYAPAITVRYTNETIQCDYEGVPAIYSVCRLDQISKWGELVSSIFLTNETFTFYTIPFPYQRNGRYMCVVSNGIPDTNGEVLQTLSTNITYEGAPVFAKENRHVKIGKVGQSITLSFLVYSYPEIENIFLEKLGRMGSRKRKIKNYSVLKSTLLYTEFDNKVGIQGYELLIHSEELQLDDFQSYCITAKNRLGASDYHFEIIKKVCLGQHDGCSFLIGKRGYCNESKKKDAFSDTFRRKCDSIWLYNHCSRLPLCKTPERDHNVPLNHNYHTYDDIGSISYRTVSNVILSNANENHDQNPTRPRAPDISHGAHFHSTDDDTTELHADILDSEFPQLEVREMQGLRISSSSNVNNVSNIDESGILSTSQNTDNTSNCNQSNANTNEGQSIQNSQTSNDSDSESSNNVMVGSVGDGYENPYEIISQEHPERHQYIEIKRERHYSISSSESHCTDQIIEQNLTKEAGYINLQV